MTDNNVDKSMANLQKNSIDTAIKRIGIGWIMLIYFASGACSLIDEVIWIRLLKLTLGNTVYASSIVVSMFMGGLAIGAFIMSKYSDRIKERLRVYALLETLITISALSLPFALKSADNFYVWYFHKYHPSNTQLLILQVIISAAILLIPSMLMGSTLPLLGRFVTAFEKEAGRLVGKLYALNTLGAATGCFLAGFILIRAVGVMGSLYIAAALNVLVAFGGWRLSRLPGIISGEMAENSIVQIKAISKTKPDSRFYILIIAFFMSGLISIGYELLWMRSIIHLLNGFTYVFSSVLTIYLLGNVIGVGIGSGIVKTLKVPAAGYAVTLFLLGLCGVFFLPFFLFWSSKIMPWIDDEVQLANHLIPLSPFITKPLIQSAFLFLVPTIMMGIGFPIALQAWTNNIHKIGRSTGTAYAANTIGAVLGGILTGFVLIPLGGLQLSITILGLSGMFIAGFMFLLFTPNSRRFRKFGLLIITGVTAIAAFAGPSNLFDKVVASNPELLKELELLELKEGTTTTVSLFRHSEEDTLYLYTSGQRIAGDTLFWRGDQKMLGHFGVLLNKNAKNVLSVGFGSGESMTCLSMHNLERADCAEIAPEVVDVSLKFFKHINLGEQLKEEVNIIYMDAKNYIHLTDIKYDAIVNDSIHPRNFADNASLYTKEYFENARDHLNENGLFMSWIPTHNVEPTVILNSIIGTMMDVFPYVTIWYMTPEPAQYFLVAGSEQPQYFSPKHMEDELMKEGVLKSLSVININNSMDIMSCYIGDKDDLKRHIKSYEVNSDYTPFIEFSTELYYGNNNMFLNFINDVRSDSIYRHLDWTGYSEDQKQQWLTGFKMLYEASTYLLLTNSTNYSLEKIRYCMEGLSILPDNPALLSIRKRSEQKLLNESTKLIEINQTAAALNISKNLLNVYPQSVIGRIIRSRALLKEDKLKLAHEAIETALRYGSTSPDVHFQMGRILSTESQFEEAIAEFQETLRLGENDPLFTTTKKMQLLKNLADSYISAGNTTEAIKTAEIALELATSTGRWEQAEETKKFLDSLQVKSNN
jgi:spermidine synthase